MPHQVRFVETGDKTEPASHNMCSDCLHYGDVVSKARHLGKEMVAVHECRLHVGCMNTKYSICCDDFDPR
jgi:hypothetical protein